MTPLHRTLTYRLHELNKLSDRESQRAYLDGAGLPLGEGRCLATIGTFAPLSIKLLARRSNMDKAQASRAAQSLVQMDLVRKQASTTDGRGVVLTLTRKGEAAWQRVMAVVQQRNVDIFGCLSASERSQLGAMFDRLIAHARADEPDELATETSAEPHAS